MKNLLCCLSSLWQRPSILFLDLDIARHKITLSIIFLGSLWLLISGLKPELGFRTREQRLTALAGLLGLLYGGLELYWYFYVGHLQSRWVAIAYYFAWHLLGGISVAVLLYIVHPKCTKVVLVISGISLVAFNLFAVSYYTPRHHASAIRFFSLGNALFIGVSISSGIFLWLDGKRNNRNGDGEAAMSGITAGSGGEA